MNTITKTAQAEIRRRHPLAEAKGFFPAVRTALWKTGNIQHPDEVISQAEFRELWAAIYKPAFMPDMYEVDCENYVISLYEIEDTHPIDNGKLLKIVMWWFTLDDDTDWDVRLFVTDRYGHSEREISIPNAYFLFLGCDPADETTKQIAKEGGIKLSE